ncbi:DUF2793 domain-containing protein [Ruegeria marina]|uniref:DUF2793 domain-containing protein n=1 Tax=Ruegeria marina TaxID=639004 RepID=A0A1G7E627_9RHOB|nr:DUF2793 domain-containing protein [Ruegeria marina]SDE59122.1 Protein of unknown function [Ruegeria marina]
MSDFSARLGLPYLMPSQAQKHVTHNEALQMLDLLVQLAVEEFDAAAPPALPSEGQVWALGAVPTGAWAGQPHSLAAWVGGTWRFETLTEGRLAVGKAQGDLRIWNGAAWQAPALPVLTGLEGVGINTGFDTSNRLSVSAPSTLLTHDGGGHQLKVNKSSDADTASLLFQTGWSGRAEMGTNGADDFSIKVSADGSTWTEALTVDRTSGQVAGAAVQSTATDASAGRLMAVGAFGLGASQLLTGTTALAARNLQPGFYSYVANAPSDAPESAAWVHNLLVLRGNPGLGSQRMAALSVRTTGSSSIRLWAGAQSGSGGSGNPLFWTEILHHNNLVGTVSQTAGSPTGAVIESGSNANGSYTRWADGTQICTNSNAAIITSPAAFAGTITKIDGDKMWIGRWF